MSETAAALLPWLGGTGAVGFAALIARAFFQALKATAEVGDEKNRTINRQEATIDRRDDEIEDLNQKLRAALQACGVKDIEIGRLRVELDRARADLDRAKGTAP